MIHTLVFICSVACTLYGAYYVVTSVLGIFVRRHREAGQHPPVRRLAAVIAARNEENVIGDLVESLRRQNYPRELLDIYVIPNSCQDRTEEIARQKGARILPCQVETHSKGDVLRYAFSQLLQAEPAYDAFCVFDADNLVDPGFMQAVNNALEEGVKVAQGYRDSKNPYDSWTSGSMSVFYWFMSRFFNSSRAGWNMSCSLNGTGFMVSREVLDTIGWDTHSLTEDLEFSALCALHGYRIGWMPSARIYDEQPVRFWDSVVQRRRWTAGSLQCMRLYVSNLLKKHTIHSVDMAIFFLGNLLAIVGMFTGMVSVYGAAALVIANPGYVLQYAPMLVLFLILYWAALSCGALIMYLLEKKWRLKALPAVLLFPVFLASWMPINLVACFTRAPRWKPIRHGQKPRERQHARRGE